MRELQNSSLPSPATPIRAAQYVRMSTEHQQYSTENQADVIRDYAAARGMHIVRTYADDGKSGLRIEGRNALRQLLEDVQNGAADFQTILVYDISRWGRFQDSDESAYYEYICKRAGINVEYCAEQFENNGSPVSTIIKSVKRAMAGEYSRELSTKVFKGQCRLIELGYRQGGPAGFGLRRMLLDQAGQQKGVLNKGDQKSLQTDRVILVPGPEDEIRIVRGIYAMFTHEGLNEARIAAWLNDERIQHPEYQRAWTASMVHQILTNEKYIGNNIYNRVSFKLKKKRVRNNPSMWVRRDSAFEPIIDPSLFFTARGIILERSRRYTDEEMLAKLRALFAAKGWLSAELIDDTDGMPSSSAYQNRFGGLVEVYRRVGYAPDRDYRFLEINRHLRRLHPGVLRDVIAKLEELGARVSSDPDTDTLLINGEYTASIVLTRCRQTPAGTLRWLINLDQSMVPDITVVVRMDASNQEATDFYLLPRIDMTKPALRLGESNGAAIDTYRYDTLGFFIGMAARTPIEEAA
jgi:DNA invertase Pin-like site-specific DNA recombinase